MTSNRLGKAAANIAAAESGDPKQRLLEEAAALIEEEMRSRPGMTQRDVAAEMKIGVAKVNRLLKELFRSRETTTPFKINWQSGSNKRPLMPSPDLMVAAALEAIKKAPPKKQKKLIQKVTNQSSVAGRHITNEVVAREKAKKEKESERDKEPLTGIPLPALWASISVTINKWTLELSRFRDEDLEELAARNPEGADAVARTVEGHAEQTQRWLRGLRPGLRAVEDGGVIEGQAVQR